MLESILLGDMEQPGGWTATPAAGLSYTDKIVRSGSRSMRLAVLQREDAYIRASRQANGSFTGQAILRGRSDAERVLRGSLRSFVPGVHDACHRDVLVTYKGEMRSVGGGWHDAANLTQNANNTHLSIYSLLRLAMRCTRRAGAGWGSERTKRLAGARLVDADALRALIAVQLRSGILLYGQHARHRRRPTDRGKGGVAFRRWVRTRGRTS